MRIGRRETCAVLLRLGLVLLPAAFAATGCSPLRGVSVPASRAIAGDIDDLDPASLALAAQRTAAALSSSKREHVTIAGREVPVSVLVRSALDVARLAGRSTDGADLTRRLARACRAVPATEPAKVTGYFEPLLRARREPDDDFRYPLYRLPSQAQMQAVRERLGHGPTRADIDAGGALDGLGLELAWLDDPVARFFLHVQGSGRLELADGTTMRVGFAGTNGFPYRSVGAVMLQEGLLSKGDATAMAMRRWLAAHPERRDELLATNPRYVFFRDNGAAGATGALGAELVAGRSIATDDAHVPRGVLAWLRTTRPLLDESGRLAGKEPLARFVFAQDAGAAIVGAARVDLFTGTGDEAGIEAGAMNEAGELAVLVCRSRR